MSHTVRDLIDATERQLTGNTRPIVIGLAAALDTTATTVTANDDVSPAPPGSVIEVDEELMLVRSVDISARTLTVRRAWGASKAQAHAADALAVVNPRFPRADILRALEDEVRSWGSQIRRIEYVTARGKGPTLRVDEAADAWHIVSAERQTATSWTPVPVRLLRGLDEGTFIHVPGVVSDESVTVRIALAMPLRLIDWNPDTVLDFVGIPPSARDIPPLGAAARLLLSAEALRTDASRQGEPVRIEAVPPGARAQLASSLWSLRTRRLAEEAANIVALQTWGGLL